MPSGKKGTRPPLDEGDRTRVYCLQCGQSYVSNDGVRKHSKRYHPLWLASRDELRLPVSGPQPPAPRADRPAAPLGKRTRELEDAPRLQRPPKLQRPLRVETGGAAAGAASGQDVEHAAPAAAGGPEPSTPSREAEMFPWELHSRNAPWTMAAEELLKRPPRSPSDGMVGHDSLREPISFWRTRLPPIKRGASLCGPLPEEPAGGLDAPGPFDVHAYPPTERDKEPLLPHKQGSGDSLLATVLNKPVVDALLAPAEGDQGSTGGGLSAVRRSLSGSLKDSES